MTNQIKIDGFYFTNCGEHLWKRDSWEIRWEPEKGKKDNWCVYHKNKKITRKKYLEEALKETIKLQEREK